MHNPASVLENDTHKLWDFDIQTDYLIPARRPDLIEINRKKENLRYCGLCCPGWPQNKSERKISNWILLGNWKKLKHEGDNFTNCDWCFWYKVLLKGLDDLEITGRVVSIQTTTLLRMARILERVLQTGGDLLLHKLYWKTISWRWFEKHSRSK